MSGPVQSGNSYAQSGRALPGGVLWSIISCRFLYRKGYLDIVKVLVNSGAEIDAVNDQGYSALLWTTENQHPNVADYLLDQG